VAVPARSVRISAASISRRLAKNFVASNSALVMRGSRSIGVPPKRVQLRY
jgi:hypothetical protein